MTDITELLKNPKFNINEWVEERNRELADYYSKEVIREDLGYTVPDKPKE